ncbi:MAG TPA: M1 family metallopeptidase [Thermoanaerobaculia bacterium]|nr:M1 family metallopeptidase [Thermoanaerobaculia bacterium]
MKHTFTFVLLVVAAFGCTHTAVPPVAVSPAVTSPVLVKDPHSFARPAEVVVEHLDLDLTPDFAQKKLSGSATLQILNRTGAGELHLDSRGLVLGSVTADGEPAKFSLGPVDPIMGQDLRVAIGPSTRSVKIVYSTRPDAEALQWLSPEQTASKKFPFLFTQSESILARTWVPCQDTPSVRMTYSATIHAPAGLLALMSAENPTEASADGVYRFRMPQAIPSYLLALAVGEMRFRKLGPNSGVYAETPVIDRAAAELVDVPKMISAAEKLYGPYRWGRYDVLILPPSFPFGGMENPRLTFATPTILAGDRSLVSLIAHELAHSWSGNLVTNATWNDMWLNEGFTRYFERRIMESLNGREYAEMLAGLGLEDLHDEIAAMTPDQTPLLQNLGGKNPDDAVNAIAYEKGAFFLRHLEEVVGRENWDRFVRDYFARFAFHSMDTKTFVDYLQANLLSKNPEWEKAAAVQEWVYGPGIPSSLPLIRSDAFTRVEQQARGFVSGTPASQIDTAKWSTHEWIHFLQSLPKKLSRSQMDDLEHTFHLSTRNTEIRVEWLVASIANGYEPVYPAIERFLTEQGRRKYLKPVYAKLMETPAGRTRALDIYRKARPTYHSVSRDTIDKIVGWPAS